MIRRLNEADYNLAVAGDLEDPEWDTFVVEAAGGHYTQTSLWAQLKASLSWRTIRIKARNGGRIVGGAQVLIRAAPLVGSVGYVTKGPLLSVSDVRLEDVIMEQIHRVREEYRIGYLVIQPPNNGQGLSVRMPTWGFSESLLAFAPAPYTTVRIDLERSTEDIQARMRSKTRYNIRLAGRRGIKVREGTEQDLSDFYRTLCATRERQGFVEYSEDYWNRFYRLFGARGYAKLFLSEYEGKVVSSVLLASFGDTVVYKKGGWMGSHKNLHPNELLHWEAIQWAKRQGYRYYDFEGILPDAAKAIQHEGSIPKAYLGTVTWFKVGFGGEVALYPGPFDYFNSPVLRWIYSTLFPRIRYRSEVNLLMNRIIRS